MDKQIEKSGEYIVIEGMDGAGKTTQTKMLADSLMSQSVEVVQVYEPGGTIIGDLLRNIIKDGSIERDPASSFDLFTIARRELAVQVIRPSLSRGATVVSDRNWFSSLAYQGFGEHLSQDYIFDRSFSVLEDLTKPNKTVIIDIPIELLQKRRDADESKKDYFEKKGIEFYERAQKGYHYLAGLFDIEIIDGDQPIDKVHKDIKNVLGIN